MNNHQNFNDSRELVTVIVSVFNRTDLIAATLHSIQQQSYPNFECILVDDGSNEETIAVIQNVIKDDTRFLFVKRPADRLKGANSCRNYGYEISKGQYINWFDSDDIMHPDFIQSKIEAIADCEVAISKTCFFKEQITNVIGFEERTRLSENLFEDFIRLKISWYLPDPMWRKSFLVGKELFRENLKKGQDRDFHTRMLLYKPSVKLVDKYVTYYRKHQETITNSYSSEVIYSYFCALNENIKLILKEHPSNDLKFFLLKMQVKNYKYLHRRKNSFFDFLKVFKTLFVFDYKNLRWFCKFLFAATLYNVVGKGDKVLKD